MSENNQDDQTENQEKQINESDLQVAIVKKGIQKNKKKLEFNWKKFSRLNSLDSSSLLPSSGVSIPSESQTNQESQSLRKCYFSIERPIHLQHSYVFSGFILIEMDETSPLSILSVEQIEKRDGFYSALPYFQRISTEFDLVIHLLERMQNLQLHEIATMLRKYRVKVQDQTHLLKAIEAEFIDEPHKLIQLQVDRTQYRNKALNSVISNRLLNETQYFLCCDMGIHFQFENFICPSAIKMSSSLFPILGINEELVNSFLLRKDIFLFLFPLHSIRTLSIALLKLYSNENQKESVILKDFEIRTIDQISVVCDATISRLEVEFPQNLLFPNFKKFPIGLESMFIVQLPLNENHLNLINTMRAQKQTCQAILSDDFEYSVFSQMFVEKFYPERLPQQPKVIEEEPEEDKDLEKRCKFKSIAQDLSQI